jgi:hypothetical protein
MQILCITTSAAAQVLTILLTAGLRPIHDFEISPILAITPPIVYTMHSALTNRQVTQIRAIAYTTVSAEPAPRIISY